MKEVSLGPVVREDGQPSDVTLAMMGWTRESWDQQNKRFRWDGAGWVRRRPNVCVQHADLPEDVQTCPCYAAAFAADAAAGLRQDRMTGRE